MESVKIGELITFENGEEYEVIDTINDNGIKYVYMARNEDDLEILLGKEIIENNEVIIETLDAKDEIDHVFKLLNEKQTTVEE